MPGLILPYSPGFKRWRTPMTNAFSRLIRDDAGATMVEYAVMLAFIAAVCIVLVTTLGGKTGSEFSSFNSQVNAV